MFFNSAKTNPGEKIIKSENTIIGGDLKINDAFDLLLVQLSGGSYELRLFMKLQFFFKNSSMNKWTKKEKQQFVIEWEKQVRKIWDGHVIKVLTSRKTIKLKLDFLVQIDGFMLDHWEITVKKVPAGTVFRSYVHPGKKNVMLTENDNSVTIRKVRKAGSYRQLTSAHEFGHMIGLDDEYGSLFGGSKGKHNKDFASVMNIGDKARQRHMSQLRKWLDKALLEKGIK